MDVFALLIPIALVAAFIASYWVIFTKAGEAGWKCLIPIYNLIVLLKIINKPVWWFILLLIPLVNIVIIIGNNCLSGHMSYISHGCLNATTYFS